MRASRIPIVLIALLACGTVLLTGSFAQRAGAPKAVGTRIAVCDLVDVFNNYQRAKDLTAKVNERREAIKAESKKRRKTVEALQMELEGLKKGSKKYEQTLNEVQRLSIEYKAYLEYQDALAAREHHNLTKEMYLEIRQMIAHVAKERGFHVVLQRESEKLDAPTTNELLRQIYGRKVLYAADNVDLTEAVLLRLNQSYRTKAPARAKP